MSDGTSSGPWMPRRSLGALGSVLVHAGLLVWLGGRAVPASEPELEPETPVEWLEVSIADQAPLALEAAREGSAGAESPAQAVEVPSETEPVRAVQRRVEPLVRPAAPDEPAVDEAPDEPPDETGPDETGPDETGPDETGPDPSASTIPPPNDSSSPSGPRGTDRGEGSGAGGSAGHGNGDGDGELDHSAYGAEIVRIVKAEIDRDPVLGISAKDSIEVELEILPSGRLARRGMGKYDYAVVLMSSVGPLRTRGILRRIATASRRFPPHPSDFPRQRYVVGITVSFRDLHGGA